MAYSKVLVADQVVQRLIEGNGIYKLCNNSFNGLVQEGATSVDIPNLAVPTVKTSGSAPDSADRKKTKDGTTNINVPLTVYAVPLAEEILSRYESNGKMLQEYLNSATLVTSEKFDELCLVQAQSTTDRTAFAGASMAWADILDIKKKFAVNKVPASGQVVAVDANLATEFFGVDVVKGAVQYNPNYLETGTFLRFMGMTFFITGLLPTITVSAAQKYTMVGFYAPGVASILSKYGEYREAWDGTNLQNNIDIVTHYGAKLLDNKFAVVKYKP